MARKMIAMKLIFLFGLFSINLIYAQSPCSTTSYTGTASSYSMTNNQNACSFIPADFLPYTCAINDQQYNTAEFCGACLEVTGNTGTDTVLVVDYGTGLGTNGLDLSPSAFEKIVGPINQGLGSVTWKVVSCPLKQNSIELTINQGSSAYYYSFVLHKSVNKINKVEAYINGNWVSLTRNNANSWSTSANNQTLFNVRITDEFGEMVMINNVDITQTSQVFTSTSNFTACSSPTTNSLSKQSLTQQLHISVQTNSIQVISPLEIEKVNMTNLQGKMVSESTNSLITTEHIASGIYILSITTSNQEIIKQTIQLY